MASKQKKESTLTTLFKDKRFQTGLLILLILIPMFLSVFLRSYPATLPIADDWAENSIKSNLRAQITAQINQQYPNLPADRKNVLINEQMQQTIAAQQKEFDKTIKEQGDYIRERLQNDDGQTYLLAIDPYYYLRRVDNLVTTGEVCDTIEEGVCRDNKVLAPLGSNTQTDFHSVVGKIVHAIARFFGNPTSVLATFFWVPVLISALGVIPAFFLTRKKAGNLGGFITATIVGVHATFLGRTAAGFSDTDAYNVTMPLFIFWFFIEAFEAKTLKNRLIYGSLTGLAIGLYTKLWTGWWYIFDFMVATVIIYICWALIKSYLAKGKKFSVNKETKDNLVTFAILLVASGIFVTLLNSFRSFLKSILAPIQFTSIQNAANVNLWPNVFTTVAELNRASLSSIVGQIGGPIYFYLACLGIIITTIPVKNQKPKHWGVFVAGAVIYLLLITKPLLTGNPFIYLILLLLPVAVGLFFLLKDQSGVDTKYAIFLTVWFAGTIYASTQGMRFILLLVPAFAVAFGILIGQLYKILNSWATTQFESEQAWLKVTLVILALLLLIKPITAAHHTAENEVPSMNDAWWNSLSKINEEAAPDAIINSWWDFGHWFKAVGGRAVTFDGGGQNTPMAHWVGRALSTPNEAEAIGILRMLDCGSREGFEQLTTEMQNGDESIQPETTVVAKQHMNNLLVLWDKVEAKQYLTEAVALDEEAAERVLALTHCEPPENYFITSSDMIGKASVWGHFGAWDFEKAYVYNVLRKSRPEGAISALTAITDLDEKEAGQLYYDALALQTEAQANQWISPWPNYLSTGVVGCEEQNNTVLCPFSRSIGQQQGSTLRIEGIIVPLDQPNATTILIRGYSQNTGQVVGEQEVKPLAISIGDGENLTKTEIAGAGLEYEVILHKNGENYQAIVASPELANSIFTKLFYFDGAYVEHFEKFSDEFSPITGDRIIIWKVDWPK